MAEDLTRRIRRGEIDDDPAMLYQALQHLYRARNARVRQAVAALAERRLEVLAPHRHPRVVAPRWQPTVTADPAGTASS